MSKTPILVVEHLTKVFTSPRRFFLFPGGQPPFTAVNNISFHLNPGEILGILGPNGAGKTTTIWMLLSSLKPTHGSIHYFGKDLNTHRSEILTQVTHASAYNRLPGTLTVMEGLDIYGRIYGLNSQERRERTLLVLDRFGIVELKNKLMNTLSAGQHTRVALAKAFLSQPKVVLLDEPTASLDPDIAKEVRAFILQQQREFNVSIILTSHNMAEVTEICDRVLVLQQGKIIEEDSPANLARSISMTKLKLQILNAKEKALDYFHTHSLKFSQEDTFFIIEIDDGRISTLLADLGMLNVQYSHISIEHPSLEDYFLHISHRNNVKGSL